MLRFVPNRDYQIIDALHPHRHGGAEHTLNGAYGRFGIIRLQEFNAEGRAHSGVGIHSGRANKGGADHATMGYIRRTNKAMEVITRHILNDPLLSITVAHNRDQHIRHPGHQGDHHLGHRTLPAH